MFKLTKVLKSFYFDGRYPTWRMPNGNIIQPRIYKTLPGYEHNNFGNIYTKNSGSIPRFGMQLRKFVFTTEPK